jgi:hypothetical protein
MANIIPFEGAKLPAYLKSFNISELNSDLTSHAGGGFPVVSIKGKVFAIVRDGERVVLPNPKDPESAATSIEVVLLKANKGTSKVFYIKGYDPEKSEGQKPDCYSTDGTAPASDAQTPQAKKCATCPHNQWGSRITERGASKGKACSDTVRLAVAPAGQINDPMLLRVPPASIRNLGEYGQMLAKRGVGYNMVVTRVGFDQDAESPKLTFKPLGLLDDEAFGEVQSELQSETVTNILGNVLAGIEAIKAVEVDQDTGEISEPVKAAPKAAPKVEPVAEPKPAAKAKAKPAPVIQDDDAELELDGINFDD